MLHKLTHREFEVIKSNPFNHKVKIIELFSPTWLGQILGKSGFEKTYAGETGPFSHWYDAELKEKVGWDKERELSNYINALVATGEIE